MFPANVLRLVTTVKIAKFYYPSLSSLLEFSPHLFSHLSKILNVVLVGQRHRLSLNAQHFSQIKCWGLPPPPHSLYNWLPTREVLVKGGGAASKFLEQPKKKRVFLRMHNPGFCQLFLALSWVPLRHAAHLTVPMFWKQYKRLEPLKGTVSAQ